jgi:hypothetical protein
MDRVIDVAVGANVNAMQASGFGESLQASPELRLGSVATELVRELDDRATLALRLAIVDAFAADARLH